MALVRNGKTLAIEFRPLPDSTDSLFLRLYLKQQPYVLQLFSANLPENISGRIWLVDKYLNLQTEVNIRDTVLYGFTPNSDTNSYRNRFLFVLNRARKVKETKTFISKAGIDTNEKGKKKLYPTRINLNGVRSSFPDIDKREYKLILRN